MTTLDEKSRVYEGVQEVSFLVQPMFFILFHNSWPVLILRVAKN